MQRNGSETSSTQGTSPAETLTSGQSLMCAPTISPDMSSVISSLASADGPTPCGLLNGPTGARSGREAARVSRFRARDNKKDMPTNDTSGPLFTSSSPSARLQLSLESRLRTAMDVNGSPEFVLTWKQWDMPAGVPICALRASAPRTRGRESFGWPTLYAHKFTSNTADPADMVDSRGNPWRPGQKPHDRRTGKHVTTTLHDFLRFYGRSDLQESAKFHGQLMGFATELVNCAPLETPSSLKSRRSSSAQPDPN